jgi:hypothetical protein
MRFVDDGERAPRQFAELKRHPRIHQGHAKRGLTPSA